MSIDQNDSEPGEYADSPCLNSEMLLRINRAQQRTSAGKG